MVQPAHANLIRLRDIDRGDLPTIDDFQLDPESNRMAVTYPRSYIAFHSHWENVFEDPNITANAIVFGSDLVGYISCFKMDGVDAVRYWIARDFWVRGIASHSMELLLKKVTIRALHARVAISNLVSLRVLQKCGFTIARVLRSPADDRYPECNEALLVLT